MFCESGNLRVTPRLRRRVLLLALLAMASVANAQVDGARRELVDAGVHVPVLTKPPELKQFIPADYPKDAEAKGLTASVKMQVTIGADGLVEDVKVMELAGNGFDEAAVTAVRRFHFAPAEIDNAPAAVTIEYVYNFTLSDAPKLQPDAGVAPQAPAPAFLTGQLLARGSRNRVEGATVRCGDSPLTDEALSDADGMFHLQVTDPVCEVRVVANGFELFTTKENLEPGDTLEVRYFLFPQAIGYETTVKGKREKKEVVRRTLERAELQKIPGSFGDPIRVLQNFPGVARAPFLSGALIVRGANPNQTGTYLDGVQIPLLFHLGGGPSVINSEFIDRIDFYPGGFGARYGRAVGGIVDVGTRKGASDTWHGSAKVDFLDTSVFIEAPVGNGASVAAAARRSYVDALIPLVLPQNPDGTTLLVLPRYWDYQVRADFGRNRRDSGAPSASSYYVMAFGSDDQLTIVSSNPAQPRDVAIDLRTLFHRVKGDWTYRAGNFTSVLTPYAGYDRAAFSFGAVRLKADVWNLGLREDAAYEVNRFFTLRAGADILFDHLNGAAELPVLAGTQYVGFPGAEPKVQFQKISRVVNSFDGALYLEGDLKLDPVTLTPGIRATHVRANGVNMDSADPRLWLRVRVSDVTNIKGSVGLYTQAPDSTNLEKEPFGNPKLTFEKAFQTSVGVEQKLTENVNVDLTGFYNRRFDNVVSPGARVVNENGSVRQEQYANNGLGRAYGMELMLRHDVTKNFFGWLAYTFSRSEVRRAKSTEWYVLSSNDQTHILTLVASYRLPYGFELGGRFRYVTGPIKTPLSRQADILQTDTGNFSPTRGAINSVRRPAFHQLDLRIDKSFLFQQWTLGVYLDVQNVYNRANEEASFFDYRFRQEIPVPGIPILPVLGVKGTF